MSTRRMEFYKGGVRFFWRWRTDDEYEAGKAFLKKLLGVNAMQSGQGDFFYFETQEQFEALMAFRTELERARDAELGR